MTIQRIVDLLRDCLDLDLQVCRRAGDKTFYLLAKELP